MLLLRSLVLALSVVLISARGPLTRPSPGASLKFTVGVQGMVYCQTCKLPGYDPRLNVSPIPGATAVLRCRTNSTNVVSMPVQTDKGGYFLLQTSELTTFTSRSCRVYVPNSPLQGCNVPVYPGYRGSNVLKFEKAITHNDGIEYTYSSGVFVFKPKKGVRCP